MLAAVLAREALGAERQAVAEDRWARHEAMAGSFKNSLDSGRPPNHPSSLVIVRLRAKDHASESEHEKQRRAGMVNAVLNAARTPSDPLGPSGSSPGPTWNSLGARMSKKVALHAIGLTFGFSLGHPFVALGPP